jgi:hydroxymethylglutaryl-CoA reductase
MKTIDSRISGFYRLSLGARRQELLSRIGAVEGDLHSINEGGIDINDADRLIENAIGVYALPLGLGLNFMINGTDYLVPMAIEEPSVVAAASNAARMVRAGGGFAADADPPVMTAQVELLDVVDPERATESLRQRSAELIDACNGLIPRLVARGGGCRGIDVRVIRDDAATGGDLPTRLVVHIHVDCQEAMGANLVNAIAEGIAPVLAACAGGRAGLRILTNLCDRRRVRVHARVPFDALARPNEDGAGVARLVASASRFAELDPYRAATHNKGVMNGIDAVAIATGNDWRGIEAGAHAFAAACGRYRPLSTWTVGDGMLLGRIELPLAVGTRGGTLQVHRAAQAVKRILGIDSAGTLGMVMAAVGLASNLAALRALATEGIQRGHMALHSRAVAPQAVVADEMDLKLAPGAVTVV